jgi:hypothetical protein
MDEKLIEIIEKMEAAGETPQAISEVVKAYNVKKKGFFEVTSEDPPLASKQAVGTSDVSGATDIDNIKDIEQQQLTDGNESFFFKTKKDVEIKAAEATEAAEAAELKAIEDEKLFDIKKQEFNETYKKPEQKSFEVYKRDRAKELNFNHKGATKDEVDRFERDAKTFYDLKSENKNKAAFNRDVAFFTENPVYLEKASDNVKKEVATQNKRKAEGKATKRRKEDKYVKDSGSDAQIDGLDKAIDELIATGDMSTLISKYGFSTSNNKNNIKWDGTFHGQIYDAAGNKFPLLNLVELSELPTIEEKDEQRSNWGEETANVNELIGFLKGNAILRNENVAGFAQAEGYRTTRTEIKAEEKLLAERALTVESQDFQDKLQFVNEYLISKDENDAVAALKKDFSKYGFDFETAGRAIPIGLPGVPEIQLSNALTVTAKDGTEHIVDLQTFFSDEEEVTKLRDFLTENVTPIPELGNAEKLEDNLKKEGIINDDAIKVLDSFKMEVKDDRVVVVPTLLKHEGIWTEYESFSEAEAKAEKAGQLYTFDTEEEAEAFMDYETSAAATYAESFARQYLEDRGLNAESLNQYKRYEEIKDVLDVLDRAVVLESAMSEEDINILKGAEMTAYVDGQVLSDEYISQMRDGLLQEKDLLYNSIYDKTDKKYAIQDLDLVLNEVFSQGAAQASQVNAQLKGVGEDLKIKVYDEYGTTIEGLKSITPKTVQEAESIDNILTEYAKTKQGRQLAANAYESSTLFYDMKHDKSISRELSEGMEAFKAEWKNGLATGDVSLVVAKFGLFPEILGGMDLNDDDAMEQAAIKISDAMSARADTDSRIMKSWAMADGFWESWDVINDDPLEFSAVMAASSISMLWAPGMAIVPRTAGAGFVTGAALGSGGGAQGMLAGGLRGGAQGLKVGMSATMVALEYGSAFMEASEFKGYDLTNPDDALMALNDGEVWSETNERGLKRGLTIGAVDYLSMSIAGRVFKAGSTAGLGKKIGAVSAQGLAIDPLTEGLGEGLAQLSVGDELDWGEIVLEMSGGFFMNSPSMAVNMGLDIKNRNNKGLADNLMDIEFISDEISSDENITRWANNMQRLGKITPEQNQRIQENVGIRRDAREVISSRGFINNVDLGNSKNRQAVNVRLMELMSAKKELESSSNLKETFSGEISKIKKEISHIAETGQNLEKEEQVPLSGITKQRGMKASTDVRPDATSYSIGKKNFSKENFIKHIEGLSGRKLRRLTAVIKNDTETSELVSDKINEAKKKAGISTETVTPKFFIKNDFAVNKETGELESVFETLELEDNTSEVTVFVRNGQDVPTSLSDITPSSERKVKGGKLLKFKPQELIDAGIATLKTETDAQTTSEVEAKEKEIAKRKKQLKSTQEKKDREYQEENWTEEEKFWNSKVGDKFVEGTIVDIGFEEDLRTDKSKDGVRVVTNVVKKGTSKTQQKIDLTTFDSQEAADQWVKERSEKIKNLHQKNLDKIDAKYDTELSTLKTETDAIQESSTEKVDAPKQTRGSKTLGEGVPGKGTTTEQVETEAVETEVEEEVTEVEVDDDVVYEMNKTDKKIWSKDFEIIDNRNGLELGPVEESNKWAVRNKVTGDMVTVDTKKDAQNIIANAPAYADMFGDGTKVEADMIITPAPKAEPQVKKELPKPVTKVSKEVKKQFEDNTISTEKLDGILVAISDKEDRGLGLTPFQKRVAAANQERLDEIVSLKTQAQEVSDLESLIDEAASDEKTQFQLSKGQTEDSRKEKQVKDAKKVFKELDKQPLAEEAVEVEAPTVTPTPIKVKENNRLLDKIKRFKLKDIIGKKLNLLMADKLKVMLMDETKPYDEETNPYVMMGGNFFPLMEKMFGKIAWASITDAATTKIIKGAMDGDYSVVYNMGNGGIMSNIIMAEMLDEKIPDNRKAELYELIKETVLGSELKQVKPAKKHIQNSTDMNSFFKLLQKEDVKSRAAVMELILPEDLDVKSEGKLAQQLQGLGISRDGLIEETSESFAKDLKAGAITMVLEVTNKDGVKVSELKKQLDERRIKEKMTKKQYDTAFKDIIASAKMTQEQQVAEGIPSHSNYPYYIRGRAVALMEETVPFYRVIKEYSDDVQARVLGVDKKRAKGLKKGLEDFEERVYTVLNKAKQDSVNKKDKKAAIQELLDSEDFKKLKAKDIKVIKPLLEQALELNNAQKIKELLYEAETPLAKMRRYSAAEAQAAAMTSAMTTSSTSYGISDYVASSYETFINMLSKSFPNVEVLATQAEFDALIKDVYAKSLSTKNQKIYGAVYKGKIYLNPRLRNFNTPIHEFGHMWLNIAKEANPEAYNKGMELITKDDTYINQVKNSPDYKRVIKEMRKQRVSEKEIDTYIKEEALATAIGDKGESFVNASVSRNFKQWLTDLFNNIKKMVGISKFTAEQLKNITLDEFLQAVTVDLLSGQVLFKDSPIGKLSESLQLMTGPNVSMQSIIEIGRQNGFPNESIKVVLLDRGFKANKINEALKVNFDLITLMPREFGNIEEGAVAGLELFTSIKEKLQRFATEGPRGGVGTTKTKSFSEIREKAQEILKAEPVYQEQAETVQLELQSALDRSLGIRSNTNVKKNIAEVRAKLEDRFIGAKTLKDAQRRMRMLIRTSLPKFDGYTRAVINRLNKTINDTTEKNFKGQATKVFNEMEKARKKVRVSLIKKIKKLVESKSKAFTRASKKRRPKGIDAVGTSYFQQVYKVLNAAAQEDVSALTALQQSIDDEVVISAIEKVSNVDFHKSVVEKMREQGATPKEIKKYIKDNITLTANERAMLDLQLALDSFAEISSMDIEQLEQLLADLKVQRAEAIVRFNNRRDAKRQVYTEKREQIEEQVKGDYDILYDDDGAPKDTNDLKKDSQSVYEYFRDRKILKGIQELTSKFTTNGKIDPNKIKVFFRNNLIHLGTITNILDRGREDGMFTKMFYDKLNEMSENHLAGKFRQEDILNDIVSSVNPKFKSYRKWALSLNKMLDDIKIPSIKKMGYISKNDALRIYALYKNPVQREKLISQGFNDKVILMDETKPYNKETNPYVDAMKKIEGFLGKDNLAIADMIVDYLSNTYFDEVNNVYIQANDVSLNYVENYFPTKTVSSETLGEMMSNGDFNGIFNAETSPALQERTDTTGDVVLQEAFTDVLKNYIDQMEQYKTYALGVQEMNNILRSDSIKTVLKETGLSMLFKASINYAINPNAGPKLPEGWVTFLGRKFIGFALNFKLIQILKQASSFVGQFEDYQTLNIGKSILIDLPMFAIDYTTSLLGVFTGKTLSKAEEISATFKDRMRKNRRGDFYTIELGTKMGTPNWVYKKIQRTKIGRTLKSAGGMGTAIGDIAGVLGQMAVYKAAKRRGMPEAEARKLFNEYNKTQQTQRATEKTPMQQSNSVFAKIFTMFISSPLLHINNTMQGTNSIMRDIGRKKMPKAKDVRKVALNLSVMNAFFVATSHVGMLLHGDDDDKEYVWNKIKDALMGKNLIYNIPIIGTAIQVAANKSSGESGFTNDGTNALVAIVEQVYKGYDRKQDKWDVWKATKPLLELSLGSDLDALIGVSDYINGDYDEEVMYEILGITKSYRPGNISVDKKFITIPVNREKKPKKKNKKKSSSISSEKINSLRLEKKPETKKTTSSSVSSAEINSLRLKKG